MLLIAYFYESRQPCFILVIKGNLSLYESFYLIHKFSQGKSIPSALSILNSISIGESFESSEDLFIQLSSVFWDPCFLGRNTRFYAKYY